MTPVEVVAMLDRWRPVWNRGVHGIEADAWKRHLEPHSPSSVEAVLERLMDDGITKPLLGDVMRYLRQDMTPRPQAYRPNDDWQGPTERGRAIIAAIRAEMRWQKPAPPADQCEVCQVVADEEWRLLRERS